MINPAVRAAAREHHLLRDVIDRMTRLGLSLTLWPTAFGTLLALVAQSGWIADLAVHFRLQYLVVGLLALPLTLLLRRPLLAMLAVIALALNAGPVMSHLGSGSTNFAQPPRAGTRVPVQAAVAKGGIDEKTVGEQTMDQQAAREQAVGERAVQQDVAIRVATLNVFYRNVNFDGIADLVSRSKADAVILLEVDRQWEREMAIRLPEYPNRHLSIIDGRSGKLVLSRLPFVERREIPSRSIRAPSPLVTLEREGVRFQVAAIHTVWPIGAEGYDSRQRDLASLAEAARASKLPFIALGDYNLSPFAPGFADLQKDSGLHNAADGAGWLPTWPAFLPIAGIQIDHVLVSDRIRATHLQTMHAPGSDHLMLVGDLRISRSGSDLLR